MSKPAFVLIILSLCTGSLAVEGVVLHDGKEIPGKVTGLVEAGVLLEGQAEPLPLHELSSVVFAGGAGEGAPEAPGSMVCFREGDTIAGRVLSADERSAAVQLEAPAGWKGTPTLLKVPLEILRALRLREAHPGDDLFESDLSRGRGPAPAPLRPSSAEEGAPREGAKDADGAPGPSPRASPGDVVYVRRQGGLMRVEGIFQSLDGEYLSLSFEGRTRRLRRDMVLGVILAPVASESVETEFPAAFELTAGGQFPAFFRGIEGERPRRQIRLRFRGSPAAEVQAVPEDFVRRVRFFSDRVLFLSSVEPTQVREVPLLGTSTPFPWRKDQSAGGSPLRLGGRTYRKGIGVHSFSSLEFNLQAGYRSLAAVVGLDDSAGPAAGVLFRVLADGTEIFKKGFKSGARPEALSLPVQGVGRIRLEVDYGEDGVDFGDFADWADLRVTR